MGRQRARHTSRSCDDASVLEPLPSMPWLAHVGAHGEAFEETAVGRVSSTDFSVVSPVAMQRLSLIASVLPKAQHEPQEL